MKLLQIASGDFFSTYGGGQVYVKNIVDEMFRQGLDVTILSFVDKNIKTNECDYNGIPLWEAGCLATTEDIEELISTIQPSIIHAHGSKAKSCIIGKHLNIPVIVTAHHGGILCPAGTLMNANDCICKTTLSHRNCLKCSLANIRSGKYWYPLMKHLPRNSYIRLGKHLKRLPFIPFITPIGCTALSLENKINEWRTICDNATSVIAPSEAIAEAMCRNGLSRDKVTVIPHGIPKLEQLPAHTKQNEKTRFFYVGRICHVKGVHILLEAFSGINNPERAELHIIGGTGNKSEQRYMKQLEEKYQASNIIWHGKVPAESIFDTIKEYDVMVHPTIYLEIFGLNISEALSMNKPVLATRCGGAEMQIEDGVNGWLVEPNDVDSLRDKMNNIVEQGVHIDVTSLSKRVIAIDEHIKELMKVYEKETIAD